MRAYFLFLFLLCSCLLSAKSKTEIYAGPHFQYTRMHFNNPSHLEGYLAGVTAGLEERWRFFSTSADFEASFNAGPFTGDPCQKSDLTEFFLEWKAAGVIHFSCFRFELYSGFGWNYFKNEQNPNGASLTYKYHKLFVPAGLYFTWLFPCGYWGMQAEFRPDVYKRLYLLGIELDPNWAYAFRIQLPYKRYMPLKKGMFFYTVVPFFDWNKFGKVEEANSVGAQLTIPRLLRWNLGLRFLIGLQF